MTTPAQSSSDEIDTTLHVLGVQIGLALIDPDEAVAEAKARLLAYFQKQMLEARIDELSMLQATQDQEVDLDGRALGKPYPVFNDGADYLISERIKSLAALYSPADTSLTKEK